MTAEEYLFAGVALLSTDAAQLLALEGGPEPLRAILHRDSGGLEAEYVRLFLNPTGSVCSLWQSAYEGERALMGAAHASAHRWYRAYGAAPQSESDPADHAGLLLTFYSRMLNAGAPHDELDLFAGRHLRWIPGFAAQVASHARHEFYREFGAWLASQLSS